MKILLTVHQFLPSYTTGTEILAYCTARELAQRGHEVRILTAHPSRSELTDEARFDSYEYKGLHVYRFHHAYLPMGGQTNMAEAEYNHRLAADGFRLVLHQYRPDVVHFFNLARLSASLIDVCQSAAIPTVFTATDFWFLCPTGQLLLPDKALCGGPDQFGVNCLRHIVELTQSTPISSVVNALPSPLLAALIATCRSGLAAPLRYARLVRALAERPMFLRPRMNAIDRVLVPTRLAARLLVDYGLTPTKVVFCPFGVDVPVRSLPRRSIAHDDRHVLKVGFIGTLYEHKGADLLVRAVKRLPDLPMELRIYGREDEFPNYVAQLHALASGDDRIRFLGTFANEAIDQIFTELDVLVVPSLWYENSPLVIYSAQAFGCPVVATDLGGLSEAVVHGENGLLFSRGDVDELAKILARLVREPDTLRRLRENARAPRSSEQYALDCLRIYDELRQARETSPPGGMQEADNSDGRAVEQ